MPTPMKWSQDFALLQPLNLDTHNMLSMRHNRSRRAMASDYGVSQVAKLARRKCLLAKLDFAMLIGRNAIGFGTSRSNDLVFPKSHGVDANHFSIQFDHSTGALLLHDKSRRGTWVTEDRRLKLVHASTHILHPGKSTGIAIGDDRHYEFALNITIPEIVPATFQQLFNAYLGTISARGATTKAEVKPRDLQRSHRRKLPEEAATTGAHCNVRPMLTTSNHLLKTQSSVEGTQPVECF